MGGGVIRFGKKKCGGAASRSGDRRSEGRQIRDKVWHDVKGQA